MLILVALNIVSKDNIVLNKAGTPIVLYTTDPERTLDDIRFCTNDVGKSMRSFIINNITRKVHSNNILDNISDNKTSDLFTGSEIKYIYYNPETKSSSTGNIQIQDVFRLDITSTDGDVFYLSLYYIKKAIKSVIQNMKLRQLLNTKYDIETVCTLDGLNSFWNTIAEKYNKDTLLNVKSAVADKMVEYGLNWKNINNIINIHQT